MRGTSGTFLFAMAMLLSSLSHSQTSANGAVTNSAAGSLQTTNDAQTIPLVELNQVPISFAIANLARQAGINYLVDRRVVQSWINSKEPSVTCKLENVTAIQAMFALCENYDLSITKDPATGTLQIEPKGFKAPRHPQLH